MINKLPILPHSQLGGFPRVMCRNICNPHGRDTMYHWVRHNICHMSGNIVFSRRLSIAEIISGFYQQSAPTSGFPLMGNLSEMPPRKSVGLFSSIKNNFLRLKIVTQIIYGKWTKSQTWQININHKVKMHCPSPTGCDKGGLPLLLKCHTGSSHLCPQYVTYQNIKRD